MIEPNGIWTLRVGRFGAPDHLTRGGVVVVERGRIIGGDSNLAYVGTCQVDGTALSGQLQVVRHGDPGFVTIFGDTETEYQLDFVGERLRRDYYEGRLFRRPDFEGRIVLRKLADLPPFPFDARPSSKRTLHIVPPDLRLPIPKPLLLTIPATALSAKSGREATPYRWRPTGKRRA